MKRFFFFVALMLIICTLFSTKLIGIGAKCFLKLKYDCEFAYRSCDWEDGRLVFSDFVLFDPTFHAHIEKASFRLDWNSFPKKLKGHIIIDAPNFTLKKERELPTSKAEWFDISLSINNGIFCWEGEVHFSFDHNTSMSQLSLEWANASALFTLQGGKLEAVLNRFSLPLLNRWIPYGEVTEGVVSGRLALDTEGYPISANVEISNAAFSLPLGGIDGLKGTLSFNQGLGAKWELKGFGRAMGEPFPFFSSGRGFYKTRWLEAEIRFDESIAQLTFDGDWNVACDSICVCEATWFQAALSAVFPEIGLWKLNSGVVSGKAAFGHSSWSAHFEADHFSVSKENYTVSFLKAIGDLTQEGGSFIINDPDYDLKFAGMWEDWNAEARIGGIELNLRGGIDENLLPVQITSGKWGDLEFAGRGWVDSSFDASFAIDGVWNLLEKKIPFYCPILSKQSDCYSFDFRLAREMWDFFRLSGHVDGDKIIYHPVSHLLGQPLQFTPCLKNEIDLSCCLPWKAISSASALLKEWGFDLKKCPEIEKTDFHFQYKEGLIDFSARDSSFAFHAKHGKSDWEIELDSNLKLKAAVTPLGAVKGFGKWKDSFETRFEGKIDPSLHFAFSLTDAKINLSAIDLLKMEGFAMGGGHFIYNGGIEADFDFNVASLIVDSFPLENEGEIHLSYTSKDGAMVRGLHLHGEFDCVVDLLQYDKESHWIFHNAQIHLPATLLTHKFLQILDKNRDLNFIANLDFASDFSTFSCTMREGSIPYGGADHRIENLDFLWKGGKCSAALRYLDHLFKIHLQIDEAIEGRIAIGEEEMPLTIDWEYTDALRIQSIEGAFSGIDASFHAESPNVLVGRAHLNFNAMDPILPKHVAEVFNEIKMGQGYELKGRLKIEKNLPFFQGILSGKAIELFGFQFRTLLAQADLGPEKVRIYDIKISDTAGVMKIDELLIEDHNPWTIAIPNLTILRMRPSLLIRPGETIGPINPLVVRELKITDFKGILDDGKTYTGKGILHFINSYKREETVFDLPANVLSRIVGLDLDLLIPVTGDLTFEIKDGYFNLLELSNAYSEGNRSEFFLETEPPPRMDLDGNLQIFIKMKQFVLLKITESFLISIDGTLDDPQFRLKKKRFFGIL